MTPYPADFGDVLLSCWPGIVVTLGILIPALAVIAAIGLAARAVRWWRRGQREYRQLLKDGDIGLAAARGATRAMDLGELDAAYGPRLSDLTGPDHVATGQLTAVQDALTPRMVAPTRADLDSARQSCHRCRTGSAAFRCTCAADCFEVHCHGGLT